MKALLPCRVDSSIFSQVGLMKLWVLTVHFKNKSYEWKVCIYTVLYHYKQNGRNKSSCLWTNNQIHLWCFVI